jgi:hypothetical protein
MKKILFLLAFLSVANAQVILNETFSSMRDSTKSNLLHYWVLDSSYATATKDKAGSFNLVENGNIVYNPGSATYNGGLHGDGFSASNYFQTADNFDITGNFTFSVWFKRDNATNPGKNMRLISSDNGSTLRNAFIFYHNTSQTLLFDIFISNSVFLVSFNVTGSAFWNKYFDGNWHNVVATHDGSTIEIYLDGVKSTNSTAAVGVVDKDLTPYTIGVSYSGSEPFDGEIDVIEVFNTALSAAQVKENIALFPGWVSKNGNVTRDLTVPEWFQTFHDTIGTVIPTATLASGKRYQLRFDAKSSDANKTIRVWAGSATAPKTEVKTVTASSGWSVHTLDFGYGYDLTGDTLWFATNSLADTVSIDNVRMEAVTARAGKGFGGWLGW